MENQHSRNIMYLPNHIQELKGFLKIMMKRVKKMKKLKRMITDTNDRKAFRASTKRLKKLVQDFQRKLGEFKKEDVQGFFALRIKELRERFLTEEPETSDDEEEEEFLAHSVKQLGIGLSHCLLKSLWVLMLMNQETEKHMMIEKVIYLLEQLSVGENDHSSTVMNLLISVVGNGAEHLDFAREKMVSSSFEKRETDQLLGTILNEIFCLEVVFNIPRIYPLIVLESISLDDIAKKINGFNPNLSNYISDAVSNEIEDMWEKLELPRTGSMAIESNGEENCTEYRNNLKKLKQLIDSMKEETNKVKQLDRLIEYFLDVKKFEVVTEQLDEQVEVLRAKVQVMAVHEPWEED